MEILIVVGEELIIIVLWIPRKSAIILDQIGEFVKTVSKGASIEKETGPNNNKTCACDFFKNKYSSQILTFHGFTKSAFMTYAIFYLKNDIYCDKN